MEIAFYGAAGGVTGSCFLLTAGGKRLLVDCGLFQGADEDHMSENEHGRPFPFDPVSIDYVLLTHAHLDHCGRLPLLAKLGFRGEILATGATRDLARLVLLDAARLQAEDARRESRQRARRGLPRVAPAYDEMDVLDALDRFGRVAVYDRPISLGKGLCATFGDAGHILGSAWVHVEIEDEDVSTRLLFSGDLGTGTSPLLNPPESAPASDVVVMESTYGDRRHKPLAPSVQELKEAILDTLERGGNVVIPSFALERTQEILYHLRVLIEHGELPRRLEVFVDSPMAISATDIFRRHPEAVGPELQALLAKGGDPFQFPRLRLTRETADSMAINQIHDGAVILAGSGMATGGRVLHHLKYNLWRPESSVVFVGYAAEGTLARRIIEGQREVRIFGDEIQVAARIYTIGGFSAHADQDDLQRWYRPAGAPRQTFLIHGEERARQALAKLLHAEGHAVELPGMYAEYKI